MDKRPIGYQPGKTYALDKKVPKTNKYDHVQSKLAGKTGTTVKDVQFSSIYFVMDSGNKQIAKKKTELFKRLKPATLWKLLNQQVKGESIYNWDKPDDDSLSQTSNLTSITIKTQQLPTGVDTDFLLIDLRQPQQYEQYHIKQAINFPGPNIKRDKWIPQLLQYKNKQNKIIVVYHFDEKGGIDFAKEMFEKGYDNVYLLSCGIQGFGQQIQDGLEGKNVPTFEKKEEVKMFKKKRPE